MLHQEINASPDETLECVIIRSDNETVVVNLDIEPVEKPETVPWIDPIHRAYCRLALILHSGGHTSRCPPAQTLIRTATHLSP
jgi:hypothetical protein